MFYPFFYDTKRFLDVVKEYCANETIPFFENGNEKNIPEKTKQLAFEMTAYYRKYHKFLEATFDNPSMLL